jgi:hypothetical protein
VTLRDPLLVVALVCSSRIRHKELSNALSHSGLTVSAVVIGSLMLGSV